jgi:phage replication O-like protein O
MANPQKENGFTAISNEIMDALCHIRIPGEERQILDCILRKTYGWNKCEDAIALSQFVEMTGIVKPHVIRAINGLLSKKVITVTEKGNDVAKVYKFNKDFHQWYSLPKKVTLPKKVISVTKEGNPSLPKKGTTKTTTTKDTITKTIYTHEFLSFWELYPKKSGSKKAAFDNWKKLNGQLPPIEKILEAIRKQIDWRENARDGDFRPEWKDPERWIKAKMWEVELEESEGNIAAWLKKKQAEEAQNENG